MIDDKKSKAELLKEIDELRTEIARLKALKSSPDLPESGNPIRQITKIFVDQAPDHILLMGKDGKIVFLSRNFETLLGKAMEDMIGKTTDELFQSFPLGKLFAYDAEIFNNGRHLKTVEEMGERFYRITKFPVFQENSPIYQANIVQDITDQISVEERFSESEERYHRLTENAQDIIWRTDTRGKILFVNKAVEKQLGRSVEETLGLSVRAYMPQESIDMTNQMIEAALSAVPRRDHLTVEVDYLHKDGRRIPFEVTITIVFDKNGKPRAFEGVSRNIGERKTISEKLFRKDVMLRKLASQVPGMLYLFRRSPTGEYSIPFTNDAIRDAFAVPPEEVFEDATLLFQRVHPEDISRLVESIESSAEHFIEWSCEYRVLLPGNSVRWMWGHSTPERQKDGSILWYGFNADITERKKEEERVQANEQRLRLALKSASLGMWVRDAERNHLDWDDRMYELFGVTRAQFPEPLEAWRNGVHPHDLPAMIEEREAAIRGEKDYDAEFRIVRPDGVVRIIKSNAVVMRDDKGKARYLIGINRDITESRQAEEKLKRSESQLLHSQRMASIGSFRYDYEKDEIWWSEEARRLFRIDSSAQGRFHIKDVEALVHPDDRVFWRNLTLKHMTGSEISVAENRVIFPDGTVRHHRVWAEIEMTEDGRPIVITGTVQDITERKLMEEALQHEREFNRALLENVVDGVIACNTEGKLVLFNRTARDWYNVVPVDMQRDDGLERFEICKTDGTPFNAFENTPLFRALGGEIIRDEGMVIRTPDGGILHILANAAPFWDERGVKLGAVVVLHDVTRKKLAEEALSESEKQYRLLVETTREGLVRIDNRFRITYANKQFADMLGYSVSEMMGATISDFFPEEEFADHRRQMQERAKLVSSLYERRFRCKNGQIIDCQVSASVIADENGKFAGSISFLTDITERKKAEKALKESQHFIELVLKSTPNLINIYDLVERQNIYSNKDMAQFLGYSPEQVRSMGKNLFVAVLHPDDTEKVAKHHSRCSKAKDGEILEIEYRMKHASGQWKILHSRDVVFLRTAEGKVKQIIGSTEDVTLRRQAEDALQKKTEELDRYFNHSLDLLCIADTDGYFHRLNPEWERVFGYRLDELLSQPFTSLFHPQDMEIVSNDLALLREGKPVFSSTARIRCKDGSYRWLEWRAVPYEGKLVYANARDITERLNAEMILKESEERFRTAFHTSPDGFCITRARDGLYVDVNEGLAEISGYKAEEVLGKTSLNPNIWKDEKVRNAIVEDLRKHGRVVNREAEFIRKNGEIFHGLMSACTLMIDGEMHILSATRDLTELVRQEREKYKLQEQLQQASKMESIGRLAGGVAHDFNNLLTGVMGNLALILLDLKESDPLYETLKEMHSAAEKASILTRQLLLFSKKQIVEPRILDLNELILNMQKLLRRVISEDVELQIELAKDIGKVKVDAGQIEQMLLNLAVNAKDAMPNGGTFRIETQSHVMSENFSKTNEVLTPGPYVAIRFSDTGFGMSRETKEHLFEPFFSTKPKDKGSGLGLSAVYGIVQQAKGAIDVESEEGKGATFTVYLPVAEENYDFLEPAEMTLQMPIGNETILLVEDEAIVMEMASKTLKRLGYRVLNYTDAKQASAVAKEHGEEIHLLVTDVIMPGVNGRVLAEDLLKTRPNMKVLFTSGYSEDIISHHGVLNEGLHFIGKPYSPLALAKKIREMLDTKKVQETQTCP